MSFPNGSKSGLIFFDIDVIRDAFATESRYDRYHGVAQYLSFYSVNNSVEGKV